MAKKKVRKNQLQAPSPVLRPKRVMKHHRLMSFLKQKLIDESFFWSLERVSLHPQNDYARKLDFEGLPIVVKDTYGIEKHGINFEAIRTKAYLVHQRAVRSKQIKPEYYILRSIKVYGRIGDYLVMQRIEERMIKRMTGAELDSFKTAKIELFTNLSKLRVTAMMPQARHLIAFRNTNPKDPAKGKWIVYLPYDLG